jgi:hypothetical protein
LTRDSKKRKSIKNKNNFMKKLALFVAVLGALILGLTSNVKAQTTTFYCILDISSDTCNGGGYRGSYNVTVELWTTGSGYQCTGTGTTTSGTHCVALTCSYAPNETICTYYEILTKVERSNGTCVITPNLTSTNTSLCWSYIATCNVHTPLFTVNL